MLHARFKFVDARNVHLGARADRRRCVFRHLACLRESFRRRDFHFKPLSETVGIAPDVAHLRARIAWNQFFLLKTH